MSKKTTSASDDSQDGPTVAIELITPAQAKDLIETSKFNRLIKERRVEDYRKAMIDNRWMFTGESIIFNGNELIDGYHRLRALSATTVAQMFVVVRGVDKQAFHCIDKGAGRTFADTLRVDGNENAKIVSAAVSYLAGYLKKGHFTPWGTKEYQRYEVYELYPEVNQLQATYNRNLGLRWVPSGLLIAVHIVLHHKDEQAAEEFMDAIIGEVNDLPEGHPAPVFQAYVRKNAALDKKLPGYEVKIGSGLIEAWNQWRKGIPVTKFRTPSRTPEPI